MNLTNFCYHGSAWPSPMERDRTYKESLNMAQKWGTQVKVSNYSRQGLKKVAAHCNFLALWNTHPRKQMIFGHKIHATSRPSTKHLLAIVNTISTSLDDSSNTTLVTLLSIVSSQEYSTEITNW